MKVIYEDNHLLVIDKPENIPSQLDESGDLDVVGLAKQYLKEKYQKPGNVYVGLIHRLDRPVSGLMVLAKTSKAAARLSKQMQANQIEKHYQALVNNPLPLGMIQDYLAKNQTTNTSYVTTKEKGKLAQLTILNCQPLNHCFLIELDLHSGRSHQIRVQLSSRNAPIVGDQRYNPDAKKGQQIALRCTYLSFFHPISQEKLTFTVEFNSDYYLNNAKI